MNRVNGFTWKTNTRLILCLTALAIIALIPHSNGMLVYGLSYDELLVSANTQSLKPGQENKVTFTFENSGENDIKSMILTINMPGSQQFPEAPMYILDGDGRHYVDEILSGDTFNLTETIYVDPKSANNLYLIRVDFVYQGSPIIDSRSIGFIVGPLTARAVLNLGLNDQNLASGLANERLLTIENIGDLRAENALVSIHFPNTQSIAILGPSGPWTIDSLDPGESYTITLKFFVATSTTGQTYSIPITVSYTDLDYRQKTDSFEVGVIVYGSVSITPLDSSTYPQRVTPGKTFSITSTVINLGTTTAQSVMIMPKANAYMKPLSNATIFVGDLSVNVPSSITITYVAGDVANQTYPVVLEYSYRISTSQVYTNELTIPVKISLQGQVTTSASEPQQETNRLFEYAVVAASVVVILSVVYLVRKRRAQ